MASTGKNAVRIPKRKHGGICKGCPLKRDFNLLERQVFCAHQHEQKKTDLELSHWRLIPHGMCDDHPGHQPRRRKEPVGDWIKAPAYADD